jgi:hypothetical protein
MNERANHRRTAAGLLGMVISLHQPGFGDGEFFELVGTDSGYFR